MKMFKRITVIIGIIGIIVLLGTAGTSNVGTIAEDQFNVHCIIGFVCLAIAGAGNLLEVK